MTGVQEDVEWAHVLRYGALTKVDDLKSLGLLPGSFHLDNSSNILPCRPILVFVYDIYPFFSTTVHFDMHGLFDDGSFMFYPLQDLVREFIEAEEQSLCAREISIASGQPDPGRPSYERCYESHPAIAQDRRLCSVHFHKLFSYSTITREQDDSTYRTDPEPNSRTEPYFPPIALAIHPNILIYDMTQRWANMSATLMDKVSHLSSHS